MLRLLALLILLGLGGAGYFYWKSQGPGRPPRSLAAAQQQLKDVALTGAVKTALALHASLRPYAVSVQTENGVVTLRGELPSAPLLAATERVAAAVPDVRQVVNQLSVNEAVAIAAKDAADERSIGERLDDEALEVQLRLAFSLDRDLKESRIQIHSYKKAVRLFGDIASPALRASALRTAADIPGVRSVVDQLSFRSGIGTGEERRAAVLTALQGSATLKRSAIRVRLDDDTIVLEGRVSSKGARELAGLIAKDAAGAAVRNQLEVQR